MTGKTLYDKIWDAHLVHEAPGESAVIYVDRHLVHEVTSTQAIEGLSNAGRKARRPELALAVADHNVPTKDRDKRIADPESREQIATLERNAKDFGIDYLAMDDIRQGIVHIVGPEQGFTLPGTTVVCGDSHTSTHGAFGALAFGIGTSDVEHVLATQTLLMPKSHNMHISMNGTLPIGVTAKDIALAIIAKIGTAGGTGYVIEYAGDAITNLSMEGRMTLCNMTIEAGARAGLIAPDEKTFAYVAGKPRAPKAAQFEHAVMYWKTLKSDPDAKSDTEIVLNAADIVPMVTWGTSPEQALPVTANVPDPAAIHDPSHRASVERALHYMGLEPGAALKDVKVDRVFIGSCTNGRIEDLRAAAAIAKGKKVASHVNAMVVPGSGLVKAQAEEEGLDEIFLEAGFEWRDPGCSMCLAQSDSELDPGERCASTSNRNFEGRQGRGGRTHQNTPTKAAAAAVHGHFVDVRRWDSE